MNAVDVSSDMVSSSRFWFSKHKICVGESALDIHTFSKLTDLPPRFPSLTEAKFS